MTWYNTKKMYILEQFPYFLLTKLIYFPYSVAEIKCTLGTQFKGEKKQDCHDLAIQTDFLS